MSRELGGVPLLTVFRKIYSGDFPPMSSCCCCSLSLASMTPPLLPFKPKIILTTWTWSLCTKPRIYLSRTRHRHMTCRPMYVTCMSSIIGRVIPANCHKLKGIIYWLLIRQVGLPRNSFTHSLLAVVSNNKQRRNNEMHFCHTFATHFWRNATSFKKISLIFSIIHIESMWDLGFNNGLSDCNHEKSVKEFTSQSLFQKLFTTKNVSTAGHMTTSCIPVNHVSSRTPV